MLEIPQPCARGTDHPSKVSQAAHISPALPVQVWVGGATVGRRSAH